MISFQTSSYTVVDRCSDDIFADPNSCDHFYKCDNGKPVIFTCPSNLYYNQQSKVCDWPYNVDCDPNTGERPGGSGHEGHSSNCQCDSNNDEYSSEDDTYANNYQDGRKYQEDSSEDNNYQDDRERQDYSPEGEYQGGNSVETAENQGHAEDDGSDDDGSLYYPVQGVDAQDPEVAPNTPVPQPDTDFSDRPRQTVDDLYDGQNHPYEDEIEREQSNDDKS